MSCPFIYPLHPALVWNMVLQWTTLVNLEDVSFIYLIFFALRRGQLANWFLEYNINVERFSPCLCLRSSLDLRGAMTLHHLIPHPFKNLNLSFFQRLAINLGILPIKSTSLVSQTQRLNVLFWHFLPSQNSQQQGESSMSANQVWLVCFIGVVLKKSPKPSWSNWYLVVSMAFQVLCNRQSSI